MAKHGNGAGEKQHTAPGRYARRPGDIGFAGWKLIAKRTGGNFVADEISNRSAAVAFFGLLSLFPALTATVLIYGLVVDPVLLNGHLELVSPFLPGAALEILKGRLAELIAGSDASLGIGLIVSLGISMWSASRGVDALIQILNIIYKEPVRRGFLRAGLVSIGFTLGGMAFMAVAIALLTALPAALAIIPVPSYLAWIISLARWPVMAALIFAVIFITYKLAPHRSDARGAWIAPGAAAATVLWLIGTGLFAFYVENFANYGATFGAMSAVIILMLWLYYSTIIFAMGAELNSELELITRIDTTTGPNRPMGQRGAFVADNVHD